MYPMRRGREDRERERDSVQASNRIRNAANSTHCRLDGTELRLRKRFDIDGGLPWMRGSE